MSAVERTGWRDEEISRRHRLYGYDVPAVDIDFLLVEYDREEPVAVIDYKKSGFEWLGDPTPDSSAMRALARLPLPFYVVRYEVGTWLYNVEPRNALAWTMSESLDVRSGLLDETEFVEFLYRLRGRRAPAGLLDYLRRSA